MALPIGSILGGVGGFLIGGPAGASLGAGLGGALDSGIASNSANKAASQAANASQVDINALDAKTRSIARQNAFDAADLERQLTPETADLRKTATAGVTANLGDSPETSAASNALMSGLGSPVAGSAMSPLLRAAVARAKHNLALGGNLSADTQNAVTRSALAKTGTSTNNLGLGRDVTARDLGLTSLDLENQRLSQASQIGGQEQSANEFDVGTSFNNATNLLNQLQMLRSIGDNRFSRNLSGAQLGQSIAQPVVGLDPGAVADVTVGNANSKSAALSNKANIAGQQSSNYAGLAGNLLGYSLLGYNNSSKPNYNLTPGAGMFGIK